MKKSLLLVLAFVLFTAGCSYFSQNDGTSPDPSASVINPPTSDSALEDGIYSVVVAESVVNWEAEKPLVPGGYKDTGTLAIREGGFTLADGKGMGNIVFDMNELRVISTGKVKGESGLEKHLKSDDFFAVEKFPEAKFVIQEISPLADTAEENDYTIRGELTIKGKTNGIFFPAVIREEGGKSLADASVVLDRTLWDIRYGSGKFFDDLADKVIDDFFMVNFRLVMESK